MLATEDKLAQVGISAKPTREQRSESELRATKKRTTTTTIRSARKSTTIGSPQWPKVTKNQRNNRQFHLLRRRHCRPQGAHHCSCRQDHHNQRTIKPDWLLRRRGEQSPSLACNEMPELINQNEQRHEEMCPSSAHRRRSHKSRRLPYTPRAAKQVRADRHYNDDRQSASKGRPKPAAATRTTLAPKQTTPTRSKYHSTSEISDLYENLSSHQLVNRLIKVPSKPRVSKAAHGLKMSTHCNECDCANQSSVNRRQCKKIGTSKEIKRRNDYREKHHHRSRTRIQQQDNQNCDFSKKKHGPPPAAAAAAPASKSSTLQATVYILFTSAIVLLMATSRQQQVSATSNYWPLTRTRHQVETSSTALQTQSSRHDFHRHLIGPLQQSAAAAAASAAAVAATATAALARRGQQQNLMIGQHYNNFSSIVPYSIVQDADYGAQEDQLINEPLSSSSMGADSGPDDGLAGGQQTLGVIQSDMNEFDNIANQENHHHNSQATQIIHPVDSLDVHHGKILASHSSASQRATDRALLPIDSNRLLLPQMQQIKSRFNQGCVGGTKCQFFAFCWMSGGSLGASCGLLMTCCVTPSRQEIQPGFYGPVLNDPYCGRSTSKINRIVGGTDASFGQFPWQAFVQVGGSRCGGALISSRHVVTAGHCVARSQHSPSSIKVTLGDYILNSDIESIPHEVFSVVEVLLHPNFRFTPQADRYDVAVLELDRTASYKDNIKPICLPQKDAAFVGRVAYVAGWGALQAGSKLRPKVLQHVAVPVIENHVCESWHRRKGIDIRIYDEMMCAGYELGQRDACQGDSGGPLMLNQFGVWYLVGIVSAGYSCAKQYQPGIYHRVSSSSDWISSNVYQQGGSK